MRIALLTTEPLIQTWFAQQYPEVNVYRQVVEEVLEAECLIIMVWYKVMDEYVQILNLWEKYFRLRLGSKKLVVMGWARSTASNYLTISHMPALDAQWLKNTKRVRAGRDQGPSYPTLIDPDIVPTLRKVLHSHGKRPFKKVLNQAQVSLRPLERAIAENQHREYVFGLKETALVIDHMRRAKQIWDERKAYFSLMPQYPELQKFEEIWDTWENLHQYFHKPESKLSQQLQRYQSKVLQDIVRLYEMEKPVKR